MKWYPKRRPWEMAGFVLLAAGCLAGPLRGEGRAAASIEDVWQGTLKVHGVELRVVFKISREQDGSLSATMDSPDQGAKDIPVDEVALDGGHLHLAVRSARGSFDGELKGDGKRIEGRWEQSGVSLPLVLERARAVPAVLRPQEPKRPYPYR